MKREIHWGETTLLKSTRIIGFIIINQNETEHPHAEKHPLDDYRMENYTCYLSQNYRSVENKANSVIGKYHLEQMK